MKIAESTSAGLLAACQSDVGRVRSGNEDTFICDAERGVFAVIDGVGGHAGGEVAAAIARRELELRLRRETGTVEDRLREAIAAANASILERANENPELERMACVLTAAVVTPSHVIAGHVGDTRLYKIDGRGLRKLTHDHSPVGILEDGGQLRELEAMQHPDRNQVFREVGTTPRQPTDEQFIEIVTEPLGADEGLLLCSDGLTDQVPAAEIEAIVRRNAATLERGVSELIDAANRAGGKDNVTVLLVARPLFGDVDLGSAPLVHPHGTTSEMQVPVEPTVTPASLAVSHRDDEHDGQATTAGRGWRGYAAIAVVAALLAAAALWMTGGGLGELRSVLSLPSAARSVRVLRVAPSNADFTTIAQAVAAARSGDVIEVGPGTYEERIVLRDGLTLRARPRRSAVLRRPASSQGPWTAITASRVQGATVSGFAVQGGGANAMDYGISVADAEVELDDVTVEGTRLAAVRIAGGSAARLRSSELSANSGAGLLIEAGSSPEILHNTVIGNGTATGAPRRAGVVLAPGARPVLQGNIIRGNGEPGITGLAAADAGQAYDANDIEMPRPAAARQR